jgi:hypothetical protein
MQNNTLYKSSQFKARTGSEPHNCKYTSKRVLNDECIPNDKYTS